MKKKIYGLFTILFLLMSCFFVSACGNKYENLKFKISYAYSQDATDWKEIGEDGLLLNYGAEDDALVFANNKANIYIKVEVLNVNGNDIGNLTVSAEQHVGLNFSSQSVKNNEIFPLQLNGNVNTTITVTENNSQKNTEFDLAVYKSIQDLNTVESVKPAVMKGGSINLDKIGNLLYTPAYPITNQTGVEYTLTQDNVTTSGLSIVGNVLVVQDNFTGSYVKVRATSIYNEEIYTEFYIYIVDKFSAEYNTAIKYSNKEVVGKTINLYTSDLDVVNDKYSKTNLTVSNAYGYEVAIPGTENSIKFSNVVYVKRIGIDSSYSKYNFDENNGFYGLYFTNPDVDEYSVSIDKESLHDYSVQFYNEGLIFDKDGEIIGQLDFSASTKPKCYHEFTIKRNKLASYITVEGKNYNDGDRDAVDIYTNENSKTRNLSINVIPDSSIVELTTTDLVVKQNNKVVTKVSSGKINVGFDKSATTGSLKLRVRSTPEIFDGKENSDIDYIEVEFEFSKKATADRIEAYSSLDAENKISTLLVAKGETTYLYVKVLYNEDNGNIDPSTITLNSSNNDIKFVDQGGNEVSSLTLSDNDRYRGDEEPGQSLNLGYDYIVYRIGLKTYNNAATSKITAIVGKGAVDKDGNEIKFSPELVAVAQECIDVNSTFDIKTENTNVKEFVATSDDIDDTTEENQYFAILKDTTAMFNVVDGFKNFAAIESVKVKATKNSSCVNVVDNSTASAGKHLFSVTGSAVGTTTFEVDVSFYVLEENRIVIKTTTVNMQIACYQQISSVSAVIEKDADGKTRDQITYVNSKFEEAATTSVTITPNGSFTKQIEFVNENDENKYITNVNQLAISRDANVSFTTNFVRNNGSNLFNESYTVSYAEGEIYSDKIIIKLNDSYSILDMLLSYNTLVFGQPTNYSNSTIIKVVQADKASGINVTKDSQSMSPLVKYGDEYELQLSLLGLTNNESKIGSFYAKQYFEGPLAKNHIRFEDPKYLGYTIYEYAVDDDGEIDTTQELTEVSSNRLGVTVDKTGKFTLSAHKLDNGGLFKFVIYSLDSYNDENQDFDNKYELNIRVSDGSAKYKYVIQTAIDFEELDGAGMASAGKEGETQYAHFVLGADIKDLGTTTINEFNGELSGTLNGNTYSLTYTVNTTNGGLFKTLYSKAVLRDLNLVATLAESYSVAQVGALASENNGRIENVNAVIKNSTSLTSSVTHFGALVGLNKGTINLNGASIESNNRVQLTVSSNDIAIGFVAGENQGTILGNYKGKEDLERITYDVIPYMLITSNSSVENNSYLVGGVVGKNSGNISNILIGGRILINYNSAFNPAEGYLGGVAGSTSANISNCVAISLDLGGEANALITAGIVAQTSGSVTIADCKYVSAKAVFNRFSVSSPIVGTIRSSKTVAGIVAETTASTTIEKCSVESFISKVSETSTSVTTNFYTLNGDYVYGIADNGTVNNSFVNANINALTNANAISTLTNETNTYFVGLINVGNAGANQYVRINADNMFEQVTVADESEFELAKSTALSNCLFEKIGVYYTIATTYSSGKVYYQLKSRFVEKTVTEETFADAVKLGLYTYDGTNYNKVSDSETFDNAKKYYILTWAELDNWAYDTSKNVVNISGISYALPYLVDVNGNPLMIIQPRSISANINKDYIINTSNSIYINNYNKYDETNQTYETDKTNLSVNVSTSFDIGSLYTPVKETDEFDATKVYYELTAQYNYVVKEVAEDTFDSLKSNLYVINNSNTISEIAIVNYHTGNSKNDTIPDNNALESYNRYNLKDIINLTIEPSDAQAGINYRILGSGSHLARIENNETIVFTQESDNVPIVIECSSAFNLDIKEYVILYAKPLFTEMKVEGENVVKNQENDFEAVLYTGQNATEFTISANNIYKNTSFISLFDLNDIANYLQVEYSNIEQASQLEIQKTSTNQYAIKIKDTKVEDDSSEILTFTTYLDLKYFNLKDVNGNLIDGRVKIGTVELKVLKVNSATGLAIKSNNIQNITTHDNFELKVDLFTGYVDDNQPALKEETATIEEGMFVVQTENKDSIKIKLEVLEGSTQIEELYSRLGLNKDSVDALPSLFDIYVTSSKYLESSDVKGISFGVSLNLKEEAKLISQNIKLKITVYAASNTEHSGSIVSTLKPSSASSVNVSTYAITNIQQKTTYTNLIESSEVESLIVAPGGFGTIMMIRMEPTYANVISASLTSSTETIPSLNREVNLRFTQIVYNTNTCKYETLSRNQEGLTLNLEKVSKIDADGNLEYDGLIYVHIQLEKFSGYETYLTATLNIQTGSVDNPKTDKKVTELFTTYVPGAVLLYNGINKGTNGEYLIQQGSYSNEIKIKLYGYQFNSNPTITFEWVKDNKGDPITNKNISDHISYYLVKNYNEISFDEDDDSYTMVIKFNVSKNIPAAFTFSAKLSLATKDGQMVTSQDTNDTILFYPVDNLINSVYFNQVNNGVEYLPINRSDVYDLGFTLENGSTKESQAIYQKFIDSGLNLLDFLTFKKEGVEYKLSDATSHPEFISVFKEDNLIITGLESFDNQIYLNIPYYYAFNDSTKTYALQFGVPAEGTDYFLHKQYLTYDFNLVIYAGESEDNALPINSIADMFNADGSSKLDKGGHYVLMNDLDLSELVDESGNIVPIKPIDKIIGSFDGNNKVIKIAKFAVDPTKTNYGLFEQIGEYTLPGQQATKTILKNVIVDYSKFDGYLSVPDSDVTFGGLVAVNNGGLIYNCDVMNISNSHKVIEISVNGTDERSVVFGGLVGENKGVITNSRVGRSSYTQIIVTNSYEREYEINASSLEFKVLNKADLEGKEANNFEIVAGGFVGKNINEGNLQGIIASSYVANTSLITSSTNQEGDNKTAGFVGENQGKVSYSYVKKLEKDVDEDKPTGTIKIENTGNGIVAGFVYTNTGDINNSYANTELYTTSAFVSGFVYENVGTISTCYAACMLNSGVEGGFAEQPFVGVTPKGELLSTGELENTYYLIRNNITQTAAPEGKYQAVALNASNFAVAENLNGFVFTLTEMQAERAHGIWSYYSLDGTKHSVPELINANFVAHSYRYLHSTENGKFNYVNAAKYRPGSENNPYIIRSVDEFNNILAPSYEQENGTVKTATSNSGYYRLIDNINFNDNETAIRTRIGYTFGNEKNANDVSSFDGNGMTIEGVYFDVGEANVESIGLFSQIKNAYIKNINLKFSAPRKDNQFSTTQVRFSGGLAGKIENSVIMNIDLDGSSTTLTGKNFVGGLAGAITGNSFVYGITSNLSVKTSVSNVTDYIYYNQEDYNSLSKIKDYTRYLEENMSYAGGLAGIIDINKRYKDAFNLSYITIRGDEMTAKVKNGVPEANIKAEVVGGIAGYISQEVNALKIKYYMGETDYISGSKIAGGLFGIALGSITASQVTADEDLQFATYDKSLSEYVVDMSENKAKDISSYGKVGNLNMIESYGYAGGLVGVSLGANVKASYSRASFKNGVVVGGLIGASVASGISYSYAVPYINLTSRMKSVGGLIGSAYEIATNSPARNSAVREFESLTILKASESERRSRTTDIQYTFSTILLNNVGLTTEFTSTLSSSLVADYICADYENSSLTAAGSNLLSHNYAGKIDFKKADGSRILKNRNEARAETVDLVKLFDINNDEHVTTFREVFDWSLVKYWSLNPNKYFPLLVDKEVDNYILIEQASDFEKLIANPTLSYKIVKDIDMSSWQTTSNWIFNVDFQGTLIGEVGPNANRPKITGLTLNAVSGNNTAGLFRKTTGANILNIEFEWATFTIGENITYVAGFSCEDKGSTITDVFVKVENNAELINSTNPIKGFGGLIGTAINTEISNSTFVGSASVVLDGGADKQVYFGGLIANAEKQDEEETDETISTVNMSVIKGVVGENNATTNFNIKLSADNQAYIGGAIGYAFNASIQSVQVGNIANGVAFQNINFVVIGQAKITHIGGLVGYNLDSSIAKSDAVTSIKFTDGSEVLNSETVYAGGLVGLVNSTTEVEIASSNAKSTIETTRLTSTHLYVSGGIGSVAGKLELTKCLFTGSIDTENGQITNVYAGGAIASGITKTVEGTSGSSNLTLSEVQTNVEMFVGSSSTLVVVAGGLVGSVEKSTIEHTISSGRIVPTTKNGDDYKYSYVAGIVGYVNDSTTISNSYTLSSIITDSLSNSAVSKLHENVKKISTINALVGYIETSNVAVASEEPNTSKVTVTSTFYSSDLSLMPEDNGFGTNLATRALVYGDSYIESLFGEVDVWEEIVTSSSVIKRLPYLSNLEEALSTYRILEKVGSGMYDYKEGSAYRPKEVSNKNEIEQYPNDESPYVYYLLTQNLDSTLSEPLVVNLKGILIGGETEYSSISNIVGTVNKHSAVSNIHVNIPDTTNFAKSGVIAITNNGVIFNSSVQGHELEMTGGLIANTNAGMISYSYSTAEVLSGGAVGGIASQNNGKIMSCYFTGYLAEGAGIACQVGTNGLVYNSYTAGVVVKKGTTSFAQNSLKTENSVNNYLDNYSNHERIDQDLLEDDEKWNINNVNTAKLMAADGLNGNWYATASKGTEGYKIDSTTNSLGFGYNYCYPIYKFNKYSEVSTDPTVNTLIDIIYGEGSYQEYTGTGTYNIILDNGSEGKNGNLDNATRYSKLFDNNDSSSAYQHAFKIPHIGVLSAVHGLLNENRDYVIIYDINGRDSYKASTEWNAIGQVSKVNDFAYTAGFNGFIVSNKNFNLFSKDPASEEETTVVVQNLSKNGLFADVQNAYISDIVLGSFYGLENSGAIGTTVIGTTIVNNIKFADFEAGLINEIQGSATNDNYFGGLFGIVDAELTINNLCTTISEDIGGEIKLSSSVVIGSEIGKSTAGLIAGKMSGSLTLSITEDPTLDADAKQKLKTLYARFNNTNQVGTLVGDANSLTIHGNDFIVVLDRNQKSEGVNLFGGLVGSTTGGTTNINGLTFSFDSNTNTTNHAFNSFGGFVGNVLAETYIKNCKLDITSPAGVVITVEDSTQDIYFGLIAAKNTKALTVTGLKIKTINEGNIKFSALLTIDNITKQAVGMFVGYQDGNINISSELSYFEFESGESNGVFILKADQILNTGGISGYYKSGEVNVDKVGLEKSQLIGYGNVGGIFGYSDGKLFTADIKTNASREPESIIYKSNFTGGIELTSSEDCLPHLVLENLNYNKSENFGGLFGVLNEYFDYETYINQGYAELIDISKISIINANPISVKSVEIEETENPNNIVKNIGGVAGKFVGKYAINLENTAIVGGEYSDAILLGGVSTNAKTQTIQAYNVGGIFGTIGEPLLSSPAEGEEETTVEILLYNLVNSGQIYGYQNVGGLVGLINSSNDKVYITLKSNGEIKLVASEDVTGEFDCPFVSDHVDKVMLLKQDVLGNYINTEEKVDTNQVTIKVPIAEELTDSHSSGKVTGVANVGGIVGNVGKNVTVENMYSTAQIFGNTNIGSLFGIIEGNDYLTTTIKNNIVKDVTVKALYYGVREVTAVNVVTGVKRVEQTTVLPTAVGGFVGNVSYANISNNLLKNVTITSNEETEENTQAISTIENNLLRVTDDSSNLYSEKFDSMKTGFGGFAGNIDMSTMSINEGEQIKTNIIKDLTIDAPIGVNVGTFYGYYSIEEGEEFAINDNQKYFAAPKLISNNGITIDGAYYVGGLVGYIDAVEQIQSLNNKDLLTNELVNVTLGSKRVAMYMGGLVGKLNSNNVADFNIATTTSGVNIQINTGSSYYMGGLVGKLVINKDNNMFDGNVGTWTKLDTEGKIVPILYNDVLDDKITTSELDNTDSAVNFGGLVGMVKVSNPSGPSNDSGWTINIQGKHKYPFTVNTIENENYYDDESLFDTAQLKIQETSLTALATYANLDTINVAGSSDSSWYDASNDYNPVRGTESGTWGWSKQYTGFKTIQRCIPQSQNNGAGWDSVSVIYDAMNITNVGTMGNLELTTSSDTENSYQNLTDIVYTVYEEEEGNPTLYSAMGVAMLLQEKIEGATDEEDKIVYSTPKNDEAGVMDWIGGAIAAQEPLQTYYIDASNNDSIKDLHGFDFDIETSYCTVDPNKTISYNTGITERKAAYVTYKVKNYIKDEEGKTEAWFQFRNIFTKESSSGSLFHINGYCESTGFSVNFPYPGKTTFEKIMQWVAIIIDAIFIYATMGGGFALTAAKSGAQSLATTLIKETAKQTMKESLKQFLTKAVITACIVGINYLAFGQGQASMEAKTSYYNQVDRPIGFVSSTYSRTIDYATIDGNLKVQDSTEQIIMKDGLPYTHYSSIRPSDYYSAYWTCSKIKPEGTPGAENDEGEFVTLNKGTSFVSEADGDFIRNLNGYDYYKVCRTYVYHEGAYYVTMYGPTKTVKVSSSLNTSTLYNATLIDDVYQPGHTSIENDYSYVIGPNGYYVYGSFDGSTYKIGSTTTNGIRISDYPTNLVSNNGSSYINRYTGDELKDVEGNVLAVEYAEVGVNYKRYEKLASGNGYEGGYTEDKLTLHGYQYFKSLYYAPIGVNMTEIVNEDDEEVVKNAPKYAKYKYINNYQGNEHLVDGIEYVKVLATAGYNDAEGNPVPARYSIYQFVEECEEDASAYDLYNPVAVGEGSDGKTITIKVYPYSIYPTAIGIKDDADECVYVYIESGDETSITLKPTYFNYQGGYYFDNSEDETQKGFYFLVDPATYAAAFVNPEKDNTDRAEYQTYLELVYMYDKEAGKYSLDNNKLVPNLRKSYVMDYLNNSQHCTLYIDESGYIYKWVEYGSYSIVNGQLSKTIPVFRNHSIDDFNYNKYATNTVYGLYTRFKFNVGTSYFASNVVVASEDDVLQEDLSGLWWTTNEINTKAAEDLPDGANTTYSLKQSKYRLIPKEGVASINIRFTEKVQVIMSGRLKIGGSDKDIGSIRVT